MTNSFEEGEDDKNHGELLPRRFKKMRLKKNMSTEFEPTRREQKMS